MAERPLLRSDDAFSLQDYAVMPGDSQKTPLLDSSIDEQSFPGDDGVCARPAVHACSLRARTCACG